MQEAAFEARVRSKQAEDAAALARANADKAIELLHVTVDSPRQAEASRKEIVLKLKQLEGLAALVPLPPFFPDKCRRPARPSTLMCPPSDLTRQLQPSYSPTSRSS